jgi:carboxylesterase type B
LFAGKSVKAAKTVQKGESPKAGNLVHKVVTESGKAKVITEKDGLDGILLSGGGRSTYCE